MKRQLLFVIPLILSFVLGFGTPWDGIASENGKRITLSFQNEPLKNVIKEVSSQTGYKIEISESLLSQNVTGQYVDIDLDSFLRRMFKGMNVFQVIDAKKKELKIYSSLREKGKTVVLASRPDVDYGDQPLDGQSDKTLSALLKERDMFFESVDTGQIPLDESSGVTPAELKRRQEEFRQNSDVAAIPLDENSGSSPESLKMKQQKFYQSVDPDNIALDESGATPRELAQSQEAFYQNTDVDDIPLDETTSETPNSLRNRAQVPTEK